jgi:hypothetical protein
MGLGSLKDFDLSEARARARKARQLLRDGVDPLEARKVKRAQQALEAAKAKPLRQPPLNISTATSHNGQTITTAKNSCPAFGCTLFQKSGSCRSRRLIPGWF